MTGQSRKWMILVATIWIQAFTGTNFDFSAYSSSLKSVLGISQVQLNYLAVASDMGKFFGWSSGLVLLHLPLPVVMFMSAFMGFVGYGLQWLVIRQIISVPYILVFLMCLLAGCSICWFNTVCFVLCIRNFPSNRALALSLTVSFNGVTAALYALIADSIDPTSPKLYLLLNALLPLLTSLLALTPILLQPDLTRPDNTAQPDSLIFLIFNILAVFTGIYLMLLGSSSYSVSTTRVLLGGAVLLLAFPVFIPGITYARTWFHQITTRARVRLERSGFVLVGHDELELHKGLISSEGCVELVQLDDENGCCETVIGQSQLRMLGEEHPVKVLVRRLDFWLYYVAYFCGGTIGLVYSNNLGQIAQSLGQGSETTRLVTVYSAFSFFGRLLSAAPDYVRAKVYFARTGWLAVALVPTPIAFILLAVSGSGVILHICTALIGLSSGFIFAAAVSITSELFGPKSVGVNHNILITNIPIGSLLYGLLAALVYDANTTVVVSQQGLSAVESSAVCMGRDCYFLTFVVWGCTAVLGLTSSFFLFLRTRPTYDQFERTRIFYTY